MPSPRERKGWAVEKADGLEIRRNNVVLVYLNEQPPSVLPSERVVRVVVTVTEEE